MLGSAAVPLNLKNDRVILIYPYGAHEESLYLYVVTPSRSVQILAGLPSRLHDRGIDHPVISSVYSSFLH